MIKVIDYGAGNIGSVLNTFSRLKKRPRIIKSPKEVSTNDLLVLPGVGSFEEGIKMLRKLGFATFLKDWIKDGGKFLGICLGFQLLFKSSSESKEKKKVLGLNIFDKDIIKLPKSKTYKVPHMGWNSLKVHTNPKSSINKSDYIKKIDSEDFYFVHSYFLKGSKENISSLFTKNNNNNLAIEKIITTNYKEDIIVGIKCKNLFATQFHLEKSGECGLGLLKNWLKEMKI